MMEVGDENTWFTECLLIKGYRFMRIERKDDVTVYKIDWKDLVTILETPVITSIRI